MKQSCSGEEQRRNEGQRRSPPLRLLVARLSARPYSIEAVSTGRPTAITRVAENSPIEVNRSRHYHETVDTV